MMRFFVKNNTKIVFGWIYLYFCLDCMQKLAELRKLSDVNNIMKKSLKHIIVLFTVVFILQACTKNDSTTIVLLGTEYYVEDILNAIPDTLRDTFEQRFGEIPQGYIPQKIEGDFIVAPKQRCYSNVANWPLDVVEPNMSLHFAKQHNRVVEIHLTEALDMFTDTVYVTGYDNFFTVYYQEYKSLVIDENDAMIKRGIIIKGEMCDEGIKDLYFANIIMEVNGYVSDDLVKPGQFFIYRDGDGLARKEEE